MTSATEYNEQQQALIDAPITSRVIGVAGAGTGKTTTILGRAKKILADNATGYLLLITFTRAAANDLKKRIEFSENHDGLPFDDNGQPAIAGLSQRMMIGTFHSVIASFIRKHATEVGLDPNFSIIDENSTNIMFRNLVESNTGYMDELKKWALAPNEDKLMKKHFNLLSSTVSALINMASPEELETGTFSKQTLYYLTKTNKIITSENVAIIADFCYRMFKESIVDGKRTNTITYDQVLFIGYLMAKADMLKSEREGFIHTIVDEYQDTNLLQDYFIRYIAGERLTIVGDIDQSIYEFRGGRPSLIIDHAKEATVYNLSYNYRSYQGILDLANKVIRNNETGNDIRKDLSAIRGHSTDCKITLAVAEKDYNESEDIAESIKNLHDNFDVPYHKMAILIRSRMTLPSISQTLTRANIPVNDTTKYADFMKSDVMVDTLNYLKVFTNPKDIYAFLGIIDRPKQGIGPAAIAKLNDYALKHKMGLVEYLLSSEISELTPALKKKVEKFVKAYEQIIKSNSATNISLDGIVAFLHDSFGYTEWLMTLKNADRYKRDLITLKGVLKDFEEQYRKENQNPTLYDLANAFVFDMSSIAVREEGKDGVCLTTIHNAKGLEWDHVFLIGLEQENFPGNQIVDKDDMESERRLCYVAITRAKDTLHLYASKHRITSEDELTPSQFIGEMGINPTKVLK